MKFYLGLAASLLGLIVIEQESLASNMTYKGVNANITPGAPYNPNYFSGADRTRPYNPRSIRVDTQSDVDIARRNVISTATATLTGSSGPESGTVNFGDGSSATYTTIGSAPNRVRRVVFNNLDGTTTTIEFPIT